MSPLELLELIGLGERRHVEFKDARTRTDRPKRVEVAKAVLGMANTRDGGVVIIGVAKDGSVRGLNDSEAESWSDNTLVLDAIGVYADPWVGLRTEIVTVADSVGAHTKQTAVLHVDEFESMPVLCKKEGRDPKGELILRAGALYVRAFETVATVEISTAAQMRELITLAVEKNLGEFLRTGQRAGIDWSRVTSAADADRYRAELERFRRGE